MSDWHLELQMLAQFHFIRPLWLLTLIPLAIVLMLRWRRDDVQQRLVFFPNHLRSALMLNQGGWRSQLPLKILMLLLLLAVIICAGPTWEREASPFGEDDAALMVLLDSSPMIAERLQRVKLSPGEAVLWKDDRLLHGRDGFDPEIVARYGEDDIQRLLNDPRIIRSRAKINAAIRGAQIWLEMRENGEDFSAWLWSFVGGEPIQTPYADYRQAPTQTEQSVAMAKALKKRGFNFCGPVIVYAFMQAVGMVNDH